MSKVIRVSGNIYDRLGSLAKGFESPASVLDRIITEYEENHGIEVKADESFEKVISNDISIEYFPIDNENKFKRDLLRAKKAYVLIQKLDGSSELKIWKALKFKDESKVKGNLLSGYLRGWREKGIIKAKISVSKSDLRL